MPKPYYVVTVLRDCFSHPKLTVVIETLVSSVAGGERFIARALMKRFKSKDVRTPYPRIAVKDWRVVDVDGLKRLRAAAKASVTLRRKRAAKKAAATRARNKAARLGQR